MEDKKLAVVGRDVSRSLSPEIHGFLALRKGRRISYDKISVPPEKFGKEIKKLKKLYFGLNITSPYKTEIISRIGRLSGDAGVFGAVNTVCGNTGYNTDGLGFALSLKSVGAKLKGKRVLVLGAGGAARSVAATVVSMGADTVVYNRTLEKALALSRDIAGVKVLERLYDEPYHAVINATGVGADGGMPCGEKIISLCDLAVDLLYCPAESPFLQVAREQGKMTLNGESMLFYQAYLAQNIFFGERSDVREAEELFAEYQKGNNQ